MCTCPVRVCVSSTFICVCTFTYMDVHQVPDMSRKAITTSSHITSHRITSSITHHRHYHTSSQIITHDRTSPHHIASHHHPHIYMYIHQVLDKHRKDVHGIIHCSGGAQTKALHFIENVHVIKDNLFPVPPLFDMIHKESGTDWKEVCSFRTPRTRARARTHTHTHTSCDASNLTRSRQAPRGIQREGRRQRERLRTCYWRPRCILRGSMA